MIYIGMMDGFVVLDEDTISTKLPEVINGSSSKLPEVNNANHPKLPEVITSNGPKLPEEEVTGQKLSEMKPSTIKLPELAFVAPPFSGRPDYPYRPRPYPFPTTDYGYNPSYIPQPSYGARPYEPRPYEPQSGYGFNPYGPQIDYSNEFRPTFSRPSYGFQPYSNDETRFFY